MPLNSLAPQSSITANNALARTLQGADPPQIVTLIAGQDDEPANDTVNCTVTPDTTNAWINGRAWKITMSASGTSQWIIDPVATDDPLRHPPAAGVGLRVYLPEPSKVTNVVVEIYQDSGLSVVWSRSLLSGYSAPFPSGWVLGRWAAGDSTVTNWGTIYRIRIIVVMSQPSNVTIGHVWLECPDKARILFIEDGGYKTFLDSGYPALKRRGIPVTWALDPAILGTGSGAAERITEANVLSLASDPEDSWSFHGWDGTATATMPLSGIRVDTIRAIKWLTARGLWSGRGWRAAWVQNNAPNHAAVSGMLLAYATPNGESGTTTFPFPNRFNVPRLPLHGVSTTDMDAHFQRLKDTRQVMVCYTHGIHTGGGNDMTPTEWNYFLSKIDTGIREGWLEGTTFEKLLAGSGIQYRQGLGDWVVDYFDTQGNRVNAHLP